MNATAGVAMALAPHAESQPGAEAPGESAALVRLSGLFDEDWYRQRYLAAGGSFPIDALGHFLGGGADAGNWPNPYFDTEWYLFQNADVARAGTNALVDYIVRGEVAGCAPAPHFDLVWYRTRHAVGPQDTLLRHFLVNRLNGSVSPLAEFDPAYYLATYPDIAQARVDPFEHFLVWGYREGRNPSAAFDTRFYIRRYLDGDLSRNPLLHYRQFRSILRLHTMPPPHERALHDEVRRFTRPGAAFERFAPLPPSAPRRAKLLAYYLPQFHAIPENDAWWGDGFTEWTALARGQPRFVGHYQPRAPRDLGHYNLADPATMRRQAEMARAAGVFGFVVYFYWFNRRRLLESPLEALLADPSIEFPFCLMWANENWTRRWDGADDEVLITQDYRADDDVALIDCFARHFRDRRYIRVDGRPVLMVYRPRLIPRTRATIARWRRLFAERHGETPLLVMAQSFGDLDPRVHGLDAAVEFPPHKLVAGLPLRNAEVIALDHAATAQVFDYDDVVAASLAEAPPPYPLIKTAVPGWDNDARRQGAGLVIRDSTPAKYEAWLAALADRAVASPVFGEPFICVNAWNEWAEGAYLEPDVHYGAAYANATGRALTRRTRAGQGGASGGILLIGHDAFPAGAQHLLLHIGEVLQRRFGVAVAFLLLGGGAMQAEYEAVAPTTIVDDPDRIAAVIARAAARGSGAVIVNTAAAAMAAPIAAAAGLRVTLLIHEMPRLLAERALSAPASAAAAVASSVVFAAQCVADGFRADIPLDEVRVRIMPQGCYRPVGRDVAAGVALRAAQGIAASARLVLGMGTGDLRKGFDLFLQVWRTMRRRSPGDTVFCWIGEIDPGLRLWLGPEIAAAEATGTFQAPGFRNDVIAWLSAADAFALTSREDPYPTVVLEAIAAGLPIVAFSESGGAPDLIARTGAGLSVPMADVDAFATALGAMLDDTDTQRREAIAVAGRREFDFPTYVGALLAGSYPDLPSVSVAVTSCDYARYLPQRLGSIFAQTSPVAEVMVLDDASIDDSLAAVEAVAAEWRRDVAIVAHERRSGSPFGLWREAVERAQGTWLWIAESDDAAEPALLARLTAAAARSPDTVLAACDSRAIDGDGRPLWPDHQGYYADSGAPELAADFTMPCRAFAGRFLAERNLLLNVSAVLWRRSALAAALDRCGAELATWRLAGDWRLYLEMLAETEGSVAWVAAPLNLHRRHDASVTGALSSQRHGQEIARMHDLLSARLDLDDATTARQAAYRAEIRRSLRRRSVQRVA